MTHRAAQDVDLLKRFLSGDVAAFDELMAAHEDRVFGICLRMLRDRVHAEDKRGADPDALAAAKKLLAAAAELTRPTFESRSLRLERRWPEPLPAMADPDQFAQVVANLLQNAARYASVHGVVALAAKPAR